MADMIQLHGAYSPWKPSDDAELLKETGRYNIPLESVISQDGGGTPSPVSTGTTML